ncbi:acyl-CoA dehydrogenase [Candidatus Methylomirabilis lanthanidiphila]|uniref:Acyl-CoA dehydrogenase n=1 Tax=Candidatus Methylomirabilis lanthanidiphila TaxID=2211376 RepID=A0A564ZJJ1_9BACT|nr:acyl-CoA dehydrogenase [Candidatus Methylomirabilis lanthanidiphila]VUZ85276.1 acyl-CoA dehydrogenase [Candidatus Methylomirabilis lanthanidiphila]
MRFELTEEQRLFREMVREFAANEVAPLAKRVDEEGIFPQETVKKMGELGLMGVAIPTEYGGAGSDNVCYAIAMEEIARACASTSVVMSVNNSLVADALYKFGSEAQKQRYLTPLAGGKLLGCFALSEPGAGSDASAQQTMVSREGDVFVLNGTKNFITNALEADLALVFATVDRGLRAKGVCAVLVEKGTPGFTISKVEKKLGLHGTSCCQVVFENCRVPAENLLGEIGQGFKIAMMTLDAGRIGIAAQAVGIAQAALDISLRYAKERVAFDKPIASFQAIQWMIADMAVQIEAARLLTYRAAWLKDKGLRHTKESAMAKLFASETANRAATKALQVHGGYGYLYDFPAQRLFRDARITEIYEGTSEIQRLVIAHQLLN